MMTSRATRAKLAATIGDANGATKLPASRRAALGDLSNKVQVAKNQVKLLSVKPAENKHHTTDASIKTRIKSVPTSNLNQRRTLASKTHVPTGNHATHTETKNKADGQQKSLPLATRPGLKDGNESSSSSGRDTHRSQSSYHSTSSSTNPSSTSLKRNRSLEDVSESKTGHHDDDFFVEEDVVSRPKKARVQPWDDLDAEDVDDPLMVAEYSEDIFEYLYKLQEKYMPYANYMDDQKEIGWQQRGLLMDWIIEIHTKLHLLPETLYLACNLVDRFMTLRVVNLDKIQLVGVTALLLAAKYEEVFPPALHYFAYLTGGNFDESDILGAEKFMLQVLDFELSYPNPLNFLRRISKADNYDVQSRSFGKYLLEISVVDHELLEHSPSLHAAAAMYVSRHILGRSEWTANLVHYSGEYEEAAVRPVAHKLVKYLSGPVEHEALFKKYASKRFYKASMVARQWAKVNRELFAE